MGWRPTEGLSLAAHLTYNDTDVVDSDVQLRRRPVWKGGLAAEWLPRQHWSWVTSAVYSGSFISHWVEALIYYEAPLWVFAICYTAFGLLVVASWIIVPPRPLTRRGEANRGGDAA